MAVRVHIVTPEEEAKEERAKTIGLLNFTICLDIIAFVVVYLESVQSGVWYWQVFIWTVTIGAGVVLASLSKVFRTILAYAFVLWAGWLTLTGGM
ncbi:MAG: hypothetical protein LBR38_00575 [Synergistaceae bacterium]|jgi:hypothetical protein|nr:hypothetical protein [Synergistaceae bacterium]